MSGNYMLSSMYKLFKVKQLKKLKKKLINGDEEAMLLKYFIIYSMENEKDFILSKVRFCQAVRLRE